MSSKDEFVKKLSRELDKARNRIAELERILEESKEREGKTNLDLERALESERAAISLQRQKERAQLYLDLAGVMFVALDKNGEVEMVNRKGCEILGLDQDEIIGRNWFDNFIPESVRKEVKDVFSRIMSGQLEPVEYYENVVIDSRGNEKIIAWQNTMLKDEAGNIRGTLSSGMDVTLHRKEEMQRRRLEKQLQQAQRMESIGLLAGGIAHDFNNLLTVINNYAELLLAGLDRKDPMASDLKEILKAGSRAAELTRQLLAFSRRQVMEFRTINLNDVIKGMERMIRRIIGEHIDLTTFYAENLGHVKADQGQIEQVIMNLVVNAVDAMPDGGRLTIETADVVLDQDYADRHPDVTPGPHVMLAVSDTGCGMDEDTMQRIFDPFFTTKEKGRGTGLGLATVYGTVKQSKGNIWVYSEPGKGTSFKVYLPKAEKEMNRPEQKKNARSLGGNETILVVEDEQPVRGLIVRILGNAGYEVLAASGADEALQLQQARGSDIKLLVTDVVMPGMSGKKLAEQVTLENPGLKVLYMSGYTDNVIVHHGVLEEGTNFIAKPFSAEGLLRKVRDVLDKG